MIIVVKKWFKTLLTGLIIICNIISIFLFSSFITLYSEIFYSRCSQISIGIKNRISSYKSSINSVVGEAILEKTQFDRKQEILSASKNRIEQQLNDLEKSLKIRDQKIHKLQKYLKEKHREIVDTKKKIKSLAHIEEQSKAQIDQNIEMLTWLVDSVDGTVTELKANMILNSENAILENISDFQNYVKDLEEIMEPLGECSAISNQKELNMITNSIASTLELFSENIDLSIDSMSELIQKAAVAAVDRSSKEFDGFIEDIHQIFDTFNNILQKLKLSNSTKKYLALEEIYMESNSLLGEMIELKKKSSTENARRLLFKKDLDMLSQFGLSKDKNNLRKQLIEIQKTKSEIQEKYHKKQNIRESLEEKVDFIESEKETIRTWFEALTDEVVDNQDTATETYNIMYATLDSIHSSISFIKADLRNTSEATIRSIIEEFSKSAKAFGRMVAIIKKLDKVVDPKKKQKSIELIYQKSKSHISKIKKIVSRLSKEVKTANQKAIEESFIDFNKFIEVFKNKFYVIQDAVSAITLSSSAQLIHDLEDLSENQLESREELQNLDLILSELKIQLDSYDEKIQGFENELKIFGHSDRKRRKVLVITKSVSEGETWLIQDVKWNVKNDGIVAFENIHLNDLVVHSHECLTSNVDYDKKEFNSSHQLISWNIDTLDKKDHIDIHCLRQGFRPLHKNNKKYTRNISTPRTFRYRNLAQPISLTFIEREGEGAMVLTNTGVSDTIWNISLEFKETPEVSDIPNVKIFGLKPQQSFIKKYSYSRAGSLKPRLFEASSKYLVGIREQRSIRSENEYRCELIFENKSEFLLHLTSFEVYDIKNPKTPVIQVKDHHLEILRPNLDFRKNYDVETALDPPQFVIDYSFTLHLVYEYDTTSKIDLSELKETPDLIYNKDISAEALQEFIPNLYNQKQTSIEIHPEIQMINEEIDAIRDQIKSLESQLQEQTIMLEKKQSDKENLLILIKKEMQEEKLKEEKRKQEAKILAQKQAEEQQKLQIEKEKIAEMKAKLAKKKKTLAKKSISVKKVVEKEIAPRKEADKKKSTTKKKKSTAKKKKSTTKKKKSSTKKKISKKKKTSTNKKSTKKKKTSTKKKSTLKKSKQKKLKT
ncbi:hypothetical protein WKT22_04228 [Candidatus Lokiarchaeum ossiferum]